MQARPVHRRPRARPISVCAAMCGALGSQLTLVRAMGLCRGVAVLHMQHASTELLHKGQG